MLLNLKAFKQFLGLRLSNIFNWYTKLIKNIVIKKVVKFIEDKSEMEILAIGIGHDVSRYYNRAIKISDVNELGDVMISQLSSLFDKKNKLH